MENENKTKEELTIDEKINEENKEELEEVKEEYNGPKVVVMTEINFKAMKYYNMYTLFYRRKIYIVYIILILIALGGAAYSFILKNTLMGIVMSAFAFYMAYTAFTLEKKIDFNIANHFNHTRPTKLQIEVTDIGLTLVNDKDPSQKNLYEWVYVSPIHELNEYYYFFINKQPVILDKDPNAILEGSLEELTMIIDKQIASKPYKRITKNIVKKPITFVQPDIEEPIKVENEVIENNEVDDTSNEVDTPVNDEASSSTEVNEE